MDLKVSGFMFIDTKFKINFLMAVNLSVNLTCKCEKGPDFRANIASGQEKTRLA